MTPSNYIDETHEDEPSLDFDLVWLLGQVYAFVYQCMQQELEHTPVSTDGLWFLATIMILGDDATPSRLAQWMVRPGLLTGAFF